MKTTKSVFSLLFTGLMFLFLVNTTFAASTSKFAWANVSWQGMPGAKYYNIYYKETGDKTFKYAVPKIPWNATSYPILYLKKGVIYRYSVSAIDPSGKEIWLTGLKKLNSVPMK